MQSLREEVEWDKIDVDNILDSCKGIITVFTVVQATARKLSEGESRKKAVDGVLAHAKSSPHWSSFTEDLKKEIEDFVKAEDGEEV